jgi:glycosyltransferase involved in cell wall biosynthesis
VVIHNSVEVPSLDNGGATIRQELGIAGHAQTIGYLANYRPEKTHELLLRSFRLVVDRRPDAHLICCVICCSPETGSGLAALAREMGLESNVALLPSRSGVSPVHPSRYEGFSHSLLQAMGHTLPVVATNVGGTPEAVVDGSPG